MKNIYWEDLSEQERELIKEMGQQDEYPHRPENDAVIGKTYSVNLPYKNRDEVPEQAKELWDMFH